MTSQSPTTTRGVQVGTVVAFRNDDFVEVTAQGDAGARILCRSVQQHDGRLALGQRVLFVRPEEDPGTGYILGSIGEGTDGRDRSSSALSAQDHTDISCAPPPPMVTTAVLTQIDDAQIRIQIAGDPEPVSISPPAHWRHETMKAIRDAGEALLVEVDASVRPKRVRLLGLPALLPSSDRHFEAARIVLDGREEIVLRTRKASIVLRANGDIELVGTRITSRARSLQKLMAPMLKLN